MGFDLIGRSGPIFHLNITWWPMYLDLIYETGIFGDDEIYMMNGGDEFGISGNGFYVSCERAKKLAAALAPLDTPDFQRNRTTSQGNVFSLSGAHIREFVAFLEGSEGFSIW